MTARRIHLATLSAFLAIGFVAPATCQRKKARKLEPARCVRLAPSWKAAIREGKLLRMPLVVHSHGFY